MVSSGVFLFVSDYLNLYDDAAKRWQASKTSASHHQRVVNHYL